MNVLVAMSGGVDSSVAAALLRDAGHEVVGVTMKLWGGESDTGCCSVADVDDARRVAQQLGLDHVVFNFGDDFAAHVVEPYLEAHVAGRTPNPCIECNRHLKFARLAERAEQLGLRRARHRSPRPRRPARGRSRLAPGPRAPTGRRTRATCSTCSASGTSPGRCCPVGELRKADVRARAAALGLRTAGKADSQDVCFITSQHGRPGLRRHPLGRCTPRTVVDTGWAPPRGGRPRSSSSRSGSARVSAWPGRWAGPLRRRRRRPSPARSPSD